MLIMCLALNMIQGLEPAAPAETRRIMGIPSRKKDSVGYRL
jgi:hypothetical protein